MSLNATIMMLDCRHLGHADSLEQILDLIEQIGFEIKNIKVGEWVKKDTDGNMVSGVDAFWAQYNDQVRKELHIAYQKRNLNFFISDPLLEDHQCAPGREIELGCFVNVLWDVGEHAQPVQARVYIYEIDPVMFTQRRYDREYYAQRFLNLGKQLYDLLCPSFGWIERVSGMKCLPGYTEFSDIAILSLPMIYWANFFGPRYVEKLGKEFLLNAPGWRWEEFDDGGVMYVLSPNMAGTGPKAMVDKVKEYFGIEQVRRRVKTRT